MLGLFLASPSVAAKIKHQGSVYLDSAGLSLKHPEGVACADEFFIVADTGNSQLVRYTLSTQGLIPVAVYPLPGSSPIIAQLSAKGDIFVLDGKARAIFKMSQEGEVFDKVEPKGLPDSKLLYREVSGWIKSAIFTFWTSLPSESWFSIRQGNMSVI